MSLLFDEYPLVVNPRLAALIGLNEALVLQQVHYWTEKNAGSKMNDRDGHTWTYNTYAEWQEQFPFWSERTIRRTVSNLERLGVLVSDAFNTAAYDHTKWYRVDYAKLEVLATSMRPKWPDRSGQDGQTDADNLATSPSETTPETTGPETSCITTNNRLQEALKLFEENIGTVTPIIRNEIAAALNGYPEEWVTKAIKIAVMRNAKSWKFVKAVLDRANSQGQMIESWSEYR